LSGTKPATGSVGNGPAALYFGHNAIRAQFESGTLLFFAGDLDEIRRYARALSDAEVQYLATAADGS